MLPLRVTTWMLLVAVMMTVVTHAANDDVPPSFVETPETFAKSPAGAMNSLQSGMMLPPLKIAYWTTPNRDWTGGLDARLQGLVARLSEAQWIMFHPHQAITDLGGACKVDGDLAQLTPDCQSQCVNAGRYCALVFDNDNDDDNDDHAGLTGADIVTESARRLCIWREYYERNIFKFFDYLATLRQTKCDRSLSDNCLNRVYGMTDIDSKKIADCFHANGGVGPQIDSRNDMLEEEFSRSAHIPNISSPLVIPQLAMNGNPLYNLTDLSDWQMTAAVCNWFPIPKPAICDFCLLECPRGNDNHDPTRQCLWDLTCGDERTLQDWMEGTGPVFGQNTTTSSNTTTMMSQPPTQSPTMPITDDDAAPTPSQSPTVHDTEKPKLHHHIMNNMTDFIANMTNLTAPEEENNSTTTASNNHTTFYDVPLPPVHHHKNDTTTTSLPTSVPALAPTPALPPYMGPVTPPPPTTNNNHLNTNSNSPHSHTSSGGTLAHPVVNTSKATNTTDPKNAMEGLIVAVVVLAVMVGFVALYRRWSSRKEIYTTVVAAADRAQGGLASTASHATGEDDLHLHVEMGGTVMRRGKMGSNGYAPPATGTQGTWT
jgi:hypothetical protein